MTPPSLSALREEVARTDERIVKELRHRLELAREIGRTKAREHLPLRDYPLETEVVGRWVRGLAAAGVPGDRAETLARWCLEESVVAQEDVAGAEGGSSSGREVVVVGGLGQMGRWLSGYFAALGCHVVVVDPGEPPDRFPFPVHARLGRATGDAEFVVVATPMRRGAAIYRELLGTETEATIFDIFSVKAPLVPWIRRGIEAGYHLASAHPLFGPGTRSLFGRNLLVLDCGDPAAADAVSRLFGRSAVRVTRLPLETHDRLMADVLGLPHLTSLLFARALEAGGADPGTLVAGASTSFCRLAEVARIVTQENPELVADIQLLNPSTAKLLERTEGVLRELKEAVTGGKPASYAASLERGRAFLERTRP